MCPACVLLPPLVVCVHIVVAAVVLAPNLFTVRSDNPMVEVSRLQIVTQFVEHALLWQLNRSELLLRLAADAGFTPST